MSATTGVAIIKVISFKETDRKRLELESEQLKKIKNTYQLVREDVEAIAKAFCAKIAQIENEAKRDLGEKIADLQASRPSLPRLEIIHEAKKTAKRPPGGYEWHWVGYSSSSPNDAEFYVDLCEDREPGTPMKMVKRIPCPFDTKKPFEKYSQPADSKAFVIESSQKVPLILAKLDAKEHREHCFDDQPKVLAAEPEKSEEQILEDELRPIDPEKMDHKMIVDMIYAGAKILTVDEGSTDVPYEISIHTGIPGHQLGVNHPHGHLKKGTQQRNPVEIAIEKLNEQIDKLVLQNKDLEKIEKLKEIIGQLTLLK